MSQSRIESLLEALVNGETSDIVPRSRNEAYLKALVENGGGSAGGGNAGGGGGIFYVTATLDMENADISDDQLKTSAPCTFDKPHAEVMAAISGGQYVICKLINGANNAFIPLAQESDGEITFVMFLASLSLMVVFGEEYGHFIQTVYPDLLP